MHSTFRRVTLLVRDAVTTKVLDAVFYYFLKNLLHSWSPIHDDVIYTLSTRCKSDTYSVETTLGSFDFCLCSV
jgi:hypothetical protein